MYAASPARKEITALVCSRSRWHDCGSKTAVQAQAGLESCAAHKSDRDQCAGPPTVCGKTVAVNCSIQFFQLSSMSQAAGIAQGGTKACCLHKLSCDHVAFGTCIWALQFLDDNSRTVRVPFCCNSGGGLYLGCEVNKPSFPVQQVAVRHTSCSGTHGTTRHLSTKFCRSLLPLAP